MSAIKSKMFIDSNILLYLLSQDTAKADTVEMLLKGKPTISVQVLNEVTSVCVRKLKMSWQEIGQFLELVRNFCRVVPTEAIHDGARQIAERHYLSFYDDCIVAAAMTERCRTLYTEDMHHGLLIEENLRLCNPFR
ncbi:PIN domain-containing protein [Candidatus Fukatsuia endosymbiont of Tuberolachnus salignus]|uniref:PIN domain-containing protein n=1 Tax=Candidatus Fukatsuia endosymbiont of Tuberolachnus salignus TaxID=3077957 RepID=UPI00313F088B